ncbi:MAG: hypothetical protein F6K65_01390 [Moorea sp. SIO3C2]|nr:hypothetical protein [Moorena sp. SIO3C2]
MRYGKSLMDNLSKNPHPKYRWVFFSIDQGRQKAGIQKENTIDSIELCYRWLGLELELGEGGKEYIYNPLSFALWRRLIADSGF